MKPTNNLWFTRVENAFRPYVRFLLYFERGKIAVSPIPCHPVDAPYNDIPTVTAKVKKPVELSSNVHVHVIITFYRLIKAYWLKKKREKEKKKRCYVNNRYPSVSELLLLQQHIVCGKLDDGRAVGIPTVYTYTCMYNVAVLLITK